MFMENKFWMCIRNYGQGELIGFQTSLSNELFCNHTYLTEIVEGKLTVATMRNLSAAL